MNNISFFYTAMPRFFYVLFLLLSNNILGIEESNSLIVPIKEVTILDNTAQIIRRKDIDLKPGMNSLELLSLPVGLQEESLKLQIYPKDFIISSVSSYIEPGIIFENEEIKKLNEELKKLLAQKKNATENQSILGKERLLLESLNERTKEYISNSIFSINKKETITNWKDSATNLRKKILEVNNQILSNESAINKYDKEIIEVKFKISEITFKNKKDKRITKISVNNVYSSQKTVNLVVSYLTNNVNWEPVYNVNFTKDGNVKIEYLARLVQYTEDNWEDVKLTLSSKRVSDSRNRPKITPTRVADFKTNSNDQIYAYQQQAIVDHLNTIPEVTASMNESKLQKEEASFFFTSPEKQTLKSSLDSKFISLGSFESSTKFDSILIPKVKNKVMLKGLLSNQFSFPILNGKVQLFSERNFLGETHIPFTSPGSKFNLSFGIDQGFRINYKSLSNYTTGGILSGDTVVEKNNFITIENLESSEKIIEVKEQIPISEIESVKIELDEIKTTSGFVKEENRPGIIIWKINLKPNEIKVINLFFKVSYPKNTNLNF